MLRKDSQSYVCLKDRPPGLWSQVEKREFQEAVCRDCEGITYQCNRKKKDRFFISMENKIGVKKKCAF